MATNGLGRAHTNVHVAVCMADLGPNPLTVGRGLATTYAIATVPSQFTRALGPSF